MAISSDAQARRVLAQLTVDPGLRELEAIPLIPPVNLGLTIGAWAVFVVGSLAYWNGWLPVPVTILLSAIAIYVSFTPLHDATHRALSSNPFLNDLIGTVAANLLLPLMSTGVYRILHLEHHRWAGDTERDPDTPLVHTRWPWLRREAEALGWPEAAVHTESFGAEVSDAVENRPFEVELVRSKRRLPVAADTTVLDALRVQGIEVPTACLQGVCGRCVT